MFEILNYPGAVGAALLQEQLETNPGACSEVLRDSLGIKSLRTAIKRAQTLLQYFTWLQMHVADCLLGNGRIAYSILASKRMQDHPHQGA